MILGVAQLVKNPPAMQETWVQYLGWEDPLEKGMATHSSILAWRTPRTVYPWGCKQSDTTEQLSPSLSCSSSKKFGWAKFIKVSTMILLFLHDRSSWSNFWILSWPSRELVNVIWRSFPAGIYYQNPEQHTLVLMIISYTCIELLALFFKIWVLYAKFR